MWPPCTRCWAIHSRLALGTVQFGLPYGIANQTGQISQVDAAAILACASAAGLDTLDTASAYGESERRLGEIGVARWQIVSKLPVAIESAPDVRRWVRDSAQHTLERLRVPKLRGLLLHRSEQLLGPHGEALHEALLELKTQGTVEKVGISIYDPAELEALVPRFHLDLVQAPFSVLDRRLASSGWLARLHRAGIEVHIRSVFLQGLLLMDRLNRPAAFAKWGLLWEAWHQWLDERALTPLQACLGFALSRPEIERVIVGVDSVAHLRDIVNAAQGSFLPVPDSLSSEDPFLINPSNWALR